MFVRFVSRTASASAPSASAARRRATRPATSIAGRSERANVMVAQPTVDRDVLAVANALAVTARVRFDRAVQISRLTVFCGSSPGADPAHLDTARSLGRALAGRGIALVYGGAHVGLMGAVADATLEAG